jgi:hypothetical protein
MTPERLNSGVRRDTIARQLLDSHLSAAVNMQATIEELLEAAFFLWSMLRLYSKGHEETLVSHG